MTEMTQEELMMCTPYSDTGAWTAMLEYQLSLGRCDLRGPPGLLEKMVGQQAFVKAADDTAKDAASRP